MRNVTSVVRKETKELLASRYTLVVSIVMSLFFGVVYSSRTGGGSPVVILTSVVGLFLTYTLAGQLFYGEKMNGSIETLLCSPLSLRTLWAGKVIAVACPAGVLAAVAGGIAAAIAAIGRGASLPSAPIIAHVLIVAPLFNATLAGLVGFAQLLFGMRQNRLIGMAIFIPLSATLYIFGFRGVGDFGYGWISMGTLTAIAIVLLVVVGYLSQFLSRERIVLTLP